MAVPWLEQVLEQTQVTPVFAHTLIIPSLVPSPYGLTDRLSDEAGVDFNRNFHLDSSPITLL